MLSLIPGFEYDIFISYRLKDNKGDHWVTEFVSALKTELETTFKEDISIYFNTNPRDGLLKNVDKSLEGTLKASSSFLSSPNRIATLKALPGSMSFVLR